MDDGKRPISENHKSCKNKELKKGLCFFIPVKMSEAKEHQRTCARLWYHVKKGKTEEERQQAMEELADYRRSYKYKKQNERTTNQRRYYYKTTLAHLLEAETLNVQRIRVFLELYKSFDPDDKHGVIAAAERILEQNATTHQDD